MSYAAELASARLPILRVSSVLVFLKTSFAGTTEASAAQTCDPLGQLLTLRLLSAEIHFGQ